LRAIHRQMSTEVARGTLELYSVADDRQGVERVDQRQLYTTEAILSFTTQWFQLVLRKGLEKVLRKSLKNGGQERLHGGVEVYSPV
jgi:hypothetical protein